MPELVSVDEMLRGFLAGVVQVPVRVMVPKDRPVSFVRVWRVGGSAINRVLDEPLVTVQGWAASAAEAEVLTRQCRSALLGDVSSMPLVRGVEEVSGPYLDPDPESEQPRYSASYRLRVRALRD